MPRLVFTTLGSWGDLFPLIPIAQRLAAQGHEVVFAATPAFAELVRGEGLGFVPIGRHLGLEEYAAHPEILDSGQNGLAGIRHLMRIFLLPHLAEVFADLRRACIGADLLVTHPAQLAAPMVAESLDLRWATATVFPGNIPSAYTVPQGNPLPALRGALGRALNRAAWRNSRFVLRLLFDRPLNRVRAACGLPPRRDVFLLSGLSPELCLVLSSTLYTEPPPDWPAQVATTGFTTWDEPRAWAMPAQVQAFLDAGPPPIVFTLGASLAIDPQGFFARARQALAELGCRGLLLVGREANIDASQAKDLCVAAFAPLSRVLARSRAIVHHGGFGTTTTALRCGVPALVVPRAFDQIYHGERIAALGAGRSIAWKKLGAARLAAELRALLDEPSYREKARALGEALAGGDGVGNAVGRLEALLGAASSRAAGTARS